MPSISRIQKSGDRPLTSPPYSVFVQNTKIRTISAAAAARQAARGNLDARQRQPRGAKPRPSRNAMLEPIHSKSGGGGIRTLGGPKGPQRFSRPPRSTTPAPLRISKEGLTLFRKASVGAGAT